MRRREFIVLLGGAAAWPAAARAQSAPAPVVGLLHVSRRASFGRFMAAFQEGLKDGGYVVGRNVSIEERWAEGRVDRLPALAADLVERKVAAIATMGGEATALAAKAATGSIPIVVVLGSDPVRLGLVESFNRPGGNVTGFAHFTVTLEAKRFGLLREMVPAARTIAAMRNPTRAIAASQSAEVADAASKAGVKLVVLDASRESDFEPVFAAARAQADALLVCADPIFFSRHKQLVALAERHRLPAMYEWRDFAEAGGLMSYGTDLAHSYRLAGSYIGRILKGERVADLPVQQNERFEFVINLKTARALGLEVPHGLSARADNIIE